MQANVIDPAHLVSRDTFRKGGVVPPPMEGDAQFALFRRVPGLLLWASIFAIVYLPFVAPDVLAVIAIICVTTCTYVLLRSAYYAWVGMRRIKEAHEKGVPHPSQVPVQFTSSHANGANADASNASETLLPSHEEGAGAAPAHGSPSRTLQPADVYHIITICRCNEDPSILENTIDFMATHNNRERYIVVLALEAKDPKADVVGRLFLDKYHRSFHKILYAVHPGGIAGEVPGKSANESYAVRFAYHHLREFAPQLLHGCIVTVCDCDTLMSEAYLNALSERFATSTREGRDTFYAPPIAFARDEASADIPAPVRVADYMWSLFTLQNLARDGFAKFPCSSYSVGLELAARVGFWDTGIESIPEDFHMALKLFFCTHGRARLEPIYHPIISKHVDGGAWWSSVYQRFQQSKRHMWGVTDVGYALWMGWNRSTMPLLDRIALCLHIMEMHVTPTAWTIIAIFAMDYLVYVNPAWANDPISYMMFSTYQLIATCATLGPLLSAVVIETHAGVIADIAAGIQQVKPLPMPSVLSRMRDWLWAPLIGPAYLMIPAMLAQTKLLFMDRMNGIHVSPKTLLQRTASGRDVVIPLSPSAGDVISASPPTPNPAMQAV